MDKSKFENMASDMRPKLLRVAKRYLRSDDDAEDATQDTLFKLWCLRERLEQYHCMEAVCMTVARNICLDKLRQKHVELPIDEYADRADEAEQPPLDKREMRLVLSLIRQLPDKQRIVLRMKHIDGLEVEEIATLTGTKAEAVRMNLSRARKKIKEQFLNRRDK